MGLPVVLLHAFPLNPQMLDGVRDRCAGLRIVTPDLSVIAEESTAAPSLDVLADAVIAVLDAAGIERAVVGGVSIGGYVTMAILRRHPHRVSAVVLADTKMTADTTGAAANRERIADIVLAQRSVRVVVEELVPHLMGVTTYLSRPRVVACVQEMAGAASPTSVAWLQRAMAARPDSTSTLRSSSVPALVVVGDEDTVTPLVDARAMEGELGDVRLIIVPGSGHLAAMEDPEAFGLVLRGFVDSLSES